jgi:flagellar hook-length control protein FliK
MPPAATTLPPPIATSLQDPAWSSALGERVLFMTGHGLQTAEIRLVPHELGPITVKLVVEEGSADLTFTAQHAVTRDAIELAIPRLRDMLSDSGLSLGNATVTDHGMQREGQGHGAGQSPEQAGVAVAAGDIPAIDQSAGSSRQRITQGLIDTFV